MAHLRQMLVVAEEPRPAYDRVALTSLFAAGSAEELSLLPDPGICFVPERDQIRPAGPDERDATESGPVVIAGTSIPVRAR